ncbi:MAG: ABC transporter substrate-binding protein [Candidatus Accumulibacter sp.]|jgi:NitT/TauT family transport system substrate-binding protein|nr:ABC transporter substrate-binding protein [Accumulibacter sp.]
MSQKNFASSNLISPKRRALLAAAPAVLAAPLLGIGGTVFAQAAAPGKLTPFSFAWNQTSFCLTPIAVAKETGIFEKNGLDVSLVNYSGSTDQLLEAIATGKSDAAVGMIYRWLKPLEAGFDVKVVAGLHGGCMRLTAYKPTGITRVEELRGKTIGVPDLGAPSTHFFKVFIHKAGIDPEKEVTWRVYQRDLLGLAAEKGEIQAIADTDPLLYKIERDSKAGFTELATNASGEYHNRTCCVIGVGGKLLRENKPAVAALTRSLVEAYSWTAQHIDESAKIFLKYTTNITFEELKELYATLNLHHQSIGNDLRDEIVGYAKDFKELGVLKASTDPIKYADHVFEKVL